MELLAGSSFNYVGSNGTPSRVIVRDRNACAVSKTAHRVVVPSGK